VSTRRRSAAEEVAFRPIDNARLAALCGPLDANLRQIETGLDVTISRRGERFSISGSREKAAHAAAALKRFYEQAARDELSVEDIQLGLVDRAAPSSPRARHARPSTSRRCATSTSRSAWGPPAPARRSSRSRPRSMPSSAMP
jgi:phosphate starvation-inducible protein PhoH